MQRFFFLLCINRIANNKRYTHGDDDGRCSAGDPYGDRGVGDHLPAQSIRLSAQGR